MGDKQITTPPLVLASASPRRAALMREYGYEFRVIEPPVDEPARLAAGSSPVEFAEALGYFKARTVATLVPHGVILAGDTVVSLGDRVYGKPADRDDAGSILKILAGTTHQVITGVALLDTQTDRRLIGHEITAVTMRRLSDAQLEAYLDTGAWAGKAGAFGIQEHRDPFVERIDGSFTNVVGFPMELVGRMLRQWGIESSAPPTGTSPP